MGGVTWKYWSIGLRPVRGVSAITFVFDRPTQGYRVKDSQITRPCQYDIFREWHYCIIQLNQIHHHWFVITRELGAVSPPNTETETKVNRRHGWRLRGVEKIQSEWEYKTPFYASDTTNLLDQPLLSPSLSSLHLQSFSRQLDSVLYAQISRHHLSVNLVITG